MNFLTSNECEGWLAGRERQKPDTIADIQKLRILFPKEPARLLYFAHWIAVSLTYRQPALLWIDEWGIWNENLHLYYRFRQFYGDHRLLADAPGHLFQNYEVEDLASFLQIAMFNGWGGFILNAADYVNVFFSHDGFFDFYAADQDLLENAKNALVADETQE